MLSTTRQFLSVVVTHISDKKYNEQQFKTMIDELDEKLQLIKDSSTQYELVNGLYKSGDLRWSNISNKSLLFSCLEAMCNDTKIALKDHIRLLRLLINYGANALEQYRVETWDYGYDTNENHKSYSILKNTIFKKQCFQNDDIIIHNGYDIILSSSIPSNKHIDCLPAIFSIFIDNNKSVPIQHFFMGNSLKYPTIKQLQIAFRKLHLSPMFKIIELENKENNDRYRNINYDINSATDEKLSRKPNILNKYINSKNCNEFTNNVSFSYLYLIAAFYNKYKTEFINHVSLDIPNEIINVIINQFCFDTKDCINFIDLTNDKLLTTFCESLFLGKICNNDSLWIKWIETNILKKLNDKQLLLIKEYILNFYSDSFDRIMGKCNDSILLFLMELLADDMNKLINSNTFCKLISLKVNNIFVLKKIFEMNIEYNKINVLIWYEIWDNILFSQYKFQLMTNLSDYEVGATYDKFEISFKCMKCIWNLMLKHINYHKHKNCNFILELLIPKSKLCSFCFNHELEAANLSNILILIKNEFEKYNYLLIYELTCDILLRCTEYVNHKLLKSLICNNFFYFNIGISNQAYLNLLPNNPKIFGMNVEKVNETKRLLKEWIAYNNCKINKTVLYL